MSSRLLICGKRRISPKSQIPCLPLAVLATNTPNSLDPSLDLNQLMSANVTLQRNNFVPVKVLLVSRLVKIRELHKLVRMLVLLAKLFLESNRRKKELLIYFFTQTLLFSHVIIYLQKIPYAIKMI
uniref:Uncharacterized protein n=1 Tax=Lutzomyia longipalpis TaxID=7200 RepID=A0A1B0CXE9_LUTLO